MHCTVNVQYTRSVKWVTQRRPVRHSASILCGPTLYAGALAVTPAARTHSSRTPSPPPFLLVWPLILSLPHLTALSTAPSRPPLFSLPSRPPPHCYCSLASSSPHRAITTNITVVFKSFFSIFTSGICNKKVHQ